MTSATLTCSNSSALVERYSYFIRDTGFLHQNESILSEQKRSLSPYDEYTMKYYCSDLPHPTNKREAFPQAGTDRLVDIETNKVAFKILMQQPGSAQDKVLKGFREYVNSILLGTGAYWEGISIEGASLSNLIIIRLPFPFLTQS